MLRGMTGFGRATVERPQGVITAELSSLNRRHFELRTFMPPHLRYLESKLRQQLQQAVGRGALSLTLSARYASDSPFQLIPNAGLLADVKASAREVAQELEVDHTTAIKIVLRAGQLGDELYSRDLADAAEHQQWVLEATMAALQALLAMKEQEGQAMAADISTRIARLKMLHHQIATLAPDATTSYRSRLYERLAELQLQAEADERILREVALFAEKCDVTEELVRFDHHLAELDQAIQSEDQVEGKRLEFRLQELNREVNTIGSKTNQMAISNLVIEAKAELEKIREQLQNVE